MLDKEPSRILFQCREVHRIDDESVVEWVGVRKTAGGSHKDAPATKAAHLTRMRYAGLWPGIDLEYESAVGGIARSPRRFFRGADLGDIRLHYNVPVALAEDGSLRLTYEHGWTRETAPVAWPEIGGERRWL